MANTLIVGAALPGVMVAPPAAVAVQVGDVKFGVVSPYEPLEIKVKVGAACIGTGVPVSSEEHFAQPQDLPWEAVQSVVAT